MSGSDGFRGAARRIAAVARYALIEAARQKLVYGLLLLALLALASSFALREFNFGASELSFIADFGFGGLTLFGAALAIVYAAQGFYAIIDQRLGAPLLAKPLSREELLAGRYLASCAVAAAFVVVQSLSLAGALWARERALMTSMPEAFPPDGLVDYGSLAVYAFFQCLRLAILAAAATLLASVASSSLFAILTGFLFLVAGQLSYLADQAWSLADAPLAKTGLGAATLVVPNLRLFDIGSAVVGGEPVTLLQTAKLAAYGLLYCGFYLALAALAFRRREL